MNVDSTLMPELAEGAVAGETAAANATAAEAGETAAPGALPSRYARIDEAGRCVEFIDFPPYGVFPPSIRWQQVPEALVSVIDGDWRYDDEHQAFVPCSLDGLKAKRKREATRRRQAIESAGITLPDGVRIATAKDDQDRLSAAIDNMGRYGLQRIDFKADSGWITLSLPELTALGAAVAAHVQACFSAERHHHEVLDALESTEAVLGYDLDQGWPQVDLSASERA